MSAAPPLMILATTIAPVDSSFLIVAPLRISEWQGYRQEVKLWTVKAACWFYSRSDKLLRPRQFIPDKVIKMGPFGQLFHATHKPLEKVIQISIMFNRCYWCGANCTGKSVCYGVDYNQLMLGCNPAPGKQVTYWIDQKDHARNKSERLQSSFGINTKVCYLLLVFSMLPTWKCSC